VDTDRLNHFAEDHHGLLTLHAAARAGMSRSAWYRRIDSQLLIPVHPGVVRMPGAPVTPEQAIAAAVLAAGRGAMASHRSALRLIGVPRPDEDPVDLMFVDRTRGLELEGVVRHRPRDRLDLSPLRRLNIPCSNILRALCDTGAVDAPSVPDAVQHVVVKGLASPRQLLAAVRVHSRRGRAGVPALRDALGEWIIDDKPADRKLESAMSELLARNGFPRAEFHARIAGYEVDFWITDTPVVLECDGWEFHGVTRAQFERDRDRDAELVAAGYIPIHFTFWMVVRTPQVVVRRIRDALARWQAPPHAGD
jgi:very-short-patch-repair endonuclease